MIKVNEAYGVTNISDSATKKAISDVFKKSASDPDKFVHNLGMEYEKHLSEDGSEEDNVGKGISQYIDDLIKTLNGMQNGYY